MKRQYLFLLLVCVILYLSYLIVNYKYKEYLINTRIGYLEETNNQLTLDIRKNKETLEYYHTKAYKNKVLKKEQSMKNKGEKVIFITNEEFYQTFTQEDIILSIENSQDSMPNIYDGMTNYQRWVFFLFQKDIR